MSDRIFPDNWNFCRAREQEKQLPFYYYRTCAYSHIEWASEREKGQTQRASCVFIRTLFTLFVLYTDYYVSVITFEYITWGAHHSAVFFAVQSCNSVIDICILMNILLIVCVGVGAVRSSYAWQFSHMTTARALLQSSPFAIQYYFLCGASVRPAFFGAVDFSWNFASICSTINIQFEFSIRENGLLLARTFSKKTHPHPQHAQPRTNFTVYWTGRQYHRAIKQCDIVRLQFANCKWNCNSNGWTRFFLRRGIRPPSECWHADEATKTPLSKMKMHKCVILNTFITSYIFNIYF